MARGGAWRRVEQQQHGRRPDASDADRVRGGGEGGGMRVDLFKSLVFSSRLKLLPACKEQELCLGVSHPGEYLALGQFSDESNTGEK